MTHQLPKLPFSRFALAPYISGQTIDVHYGKHHQHYIDELNKLVADSDYADLSLEDIIQVAPPGPIFNNAAQAWNHDFYWKSLTSFGRKPRGELLRTIDKQFGSVEQLEKEIFQAASGQFGSGWAWLVQNTDGSLAVLATSNANTPLKLGKKPLLAIDVWEHAYYLDYQNDRVQYLENIRHITNWEFAELNFIEARPRRDARPADRSLSGANSGIPAI